MAAAPRPRVTLTWAQGLDGSIAREAGTRLRLSGPESAAMTHALRASHDAILVGIGTVLADDPRLDVRKAPGRSPQPVILDPTLRTPPACRLAMREDLKPWIFAARGEADPERRAALVRAGCVVVEVDRESPPRRAGGLAAERPPRVLDLHLVLEELAGRGVRSLMVEGGARVLAGFLAARLADRMVVTIAPIVVGGVNPFPEGSLALPVPLADPRWTAHGRDIVLDAVPDWEGAPDPGIA